MIRGNIELLSNETRGETELLSNRTKMVLMKGIIREMYYS
jgi:hypothetical protein